jgi:signal transduction histidine kinase/sensor domain CHASE-containing protein
LGKFFNKKLFLLVLSVLVVLNVAVAFGSKMILMDSFLQLEQQEAEKNLLRVANAVHNDAQDLGTLCTDWSAWDDTYRFVRDGNQEYIDSNLLGSTLTDLSLNALLFFDEQGGLVYGKGMDLGEDVLVAVPQEIMDYFLRRKDLRAPHLGQGRQDGLLLLPDGPMLLSFRPILTSNGDGPPRGILVMARWYNDEVVAELAVRTALNLSAEAPNVEVADPDRETSLRITDRDVETIHGEVLMRDIEGRPALRLAVAMDRGLFLQGKKTVAYFQYGFLLFSCMSGLLLYVLIVFGRQKRVVSERRFRHVFENATDGLFVVDNPKSLILINPAAKMLLCGDSADLPQAERACFAHPELGRLITDGLAGRAAGPVDLVISGPGRDVQKKLRAYMAPLVDEEGKQHGAIATLQDVTREKELDRLKNEFIASAAHELNTPLSVIMGYSDLLLDKEYIDEAEQKEFCAIIREKAYTLGKIADDLLSVGKMDAGCKIHLEKIPYDLCASVRQLIESFQKKAPRHTFIINLPENHIEIVADRHRVGQVFDNLLSNAVKYSPQGGTITLSVSRADEEFVFCVADRGVGLTEEQVARAFEKFYRVDNSETAVRGMGLGLNIAKNIIEAHAGRIWLESTPGIGTHVYFTLPCVPDEEL